VHDIRRYANNVLIANRSGYGLESGDVGIIVILRHYATPCGYNDAMWAKYGAVFVSESKASDAKAPAANPANASGETLDSLSAQGVHFGVCQMATRRYAGMVARSTGSTADAVFEELGKNLVKNAHLTPAGIVAVGRTQERGYMFGYAG
jgi:intracellular sulfur oxidation DsrE/DsrF family protein